MPGFAPGSCSVASAVPSAVAMEGMVPQNPPLLRTCPPSLASAEMTEEVKRLSPMNVSFRVLVFLLVAIGGIVVASRLVAPKKGVACCSAEVCARKHHHERSQQKQHHCGIALDCTFSEVVAFVAVRAVSSEGEGETLGSLFDHPLMSLAAHIFPSIPSATPDLSLRKGPR